MRKFFDQDLYDEYDRKAKDKVKQVLSKFPSLRVEEGENKRGVDIEVFKGDQHVFNVEVEVKSSWEGEFDYPDVNFPLRKKKFAELDKPTVFVMFNNDLTDYLSVTGHNLKNSPTEIVRNRYIPFGEQFYKVPLDKVDFDNIERTISNVI